MTQQHIKTLLKDHESNNLHWKLGIQQHVGPQIKYRKKKKPIYRS